MSVISTGNHPKAMWPGVFKFFGMTYDSQPKQWKKLFDEHDSTRKYEEVVAGRRFGPAPVLDEGASVTYQSHNQGPTTRSTHVTYASGYIVTENERDDNQYPELSKLRAGALAFSLDQTEEQVAANMFVRAFNSSYTFGDGKEMCATDHPTSAGNQSNELTTAADFSEAALEDLLIQIRTAKDDKGNIIGLKPNSLHISPANEFEAYRVLNSTLRSGTADNDVNAVRSMGMLPGGVHVNQYFYDGDPDMWFIRTKVPPKTGLIRFNRRPYRFMRDNDFGTGNALAKADIRFSVTVGDWRAIFGTPGS